MAKVFATLIAGAAASGKLALTWEDCGDASTHGKTKDMQPTEITIGDDVTIVGSGTTDKAVSSGAFTMKLSASLGIKETYEGKICEAKVFNMPLNLGTVSWGGMACPVPVGDSVVKVGVHMSSAVPASLAKADLSLTATDQDGEPAVCVNTHLAREVESQAAVAVAAGKLALTWEDCGDASTHGKTKDMQPTEITIGDDVTIVGSGTTDKAVSSGAFTMKLAASLGIKETYEGKICEAKVFNMPLNLGTVSWGGMACPVPVGDSVVKVGVHMSSAVPASLAKADLSLTATDQDGEPAVCVNTHLAREVESQAAVAVAAGKLALTWEDCGDASTHGKTEDMQPTEITIGDDVTIVGSGTTDKAVSSGAFTMKLAASLGIKETYEGKICEAKEFNMPLNIGTVSWGGMACPVPVGKSVVKVGVHMASALPASLAKADLSLTATDQDGEPAVCVNTHLARESATIV